MFNFNRRVLVMVFFLAGLVTAGVILSMPVTAVEQMQIPSPVGNCLRCHDPSIHRVNNCSACHDLGYAEPAGNPAGGHGGLNVSDANKLKSTAPVGNCQVCHKYTVSAWDMCGNCHPAQYGSMFPPAQLVPNPNAPWGAGYSHDASRVNNFLGYDNTYNCEKCHMQNWWSNIPQRDLTVFGTAYSHQNTIDSKCTGCHQNYLTTEHAQPGRSDLAGQPMTCFTCHENSSPNIKQVISNHDSSCAACHATVHSKNAAPGPSADILLYPGLQWSSPMMMTLWLGEPWVENYVYGFRTIVSNRSNLSPDSVWAFYRDGLTARGWILQSAEPAPGAASFKTVFAKGANKIIVWFYSSEERQSPGILPTGPRIEIIYNV